MLARYKIYRGKRPDSDPLPAGTRMDTRKHTRHVLRPTPSIVNAYLSAPSEDTWNKFRQIYNSMLEERYAADPQPFIALAETAIGTDVFLGCNCPTKTNPSVFHCHTVLALEFMKSKFANIAVRFPD